MPHACFHLRPQGCCPSTVTDRWLWPTLSPSIATPAPTGGGTAAGRDRHRYELFQADSPFPISFTPASLLADRIRPGPALRAQSKSVTPVAVGTSRIPVLEPTLL